MAISNNPSSGTLSGTLGVAASTGVSTFSDFSIDKAGTGYTFQATATGLTPATSASFDIGVGVATQLEFAVQPSNTGATASITPAVPSQRIGCRRKHRYRIFRKYHYCDQ